MWRLAIFGGLLALLMAAAWLPACGDKPIGDEHSTGDEQPNLKAAVDAMKGGESTGNERPNLKAAVDAMKDDEPTGDEHPILQAAVDAMRKVDSFHFSEFLDVSNYAGGRSFSANGDFQSPDRIQKQALFGYTSPLPHSRTFDNYIRTIDVGSASYLLDPATGKWMNIDDPKSFSPRGWIKKPLQRRPIEFFESVVSSLGPDATVDTISVDGIDLFHVQNRTKTFETNGQKMIDSHVEIWIGVDDSLVRELRRRDEWSVIPCSKISSDICLDIALVPGSSSREIVFSEFGKEVNIEAPPIEEVEFITSPFGPMALYERALVPFSIQFPATWNRKVIDLDPTLADFRLADPSGGQLLVKMYFFDEVPSEDKYGRCMVDPAEERWVEDCKSLEPFISKMAMDEATAGDYIDLWEPVAVRGSRWEAVFSRELETRSRRTIATGTGLAGEIPELGPAPRGASGQYLFHRITYLFRLPTPQPGCHEEAQSCHVVVNVGYSTTTETIDTLRDVIEYSFSTARAATIQAPQTPTTTARQTALSHLSELVPWFDGEASGADSRLRNAVVGIWLHDPAIGEAVALMPWVADRSSEDEARFVSAFSDTAFMQTGTAKRTVGLPWVVDGVDRHEAQAMESLRDMLSDTPKSGTRVFELSWVIDDMTRPEAAVLGSLARLSAEDADILSKVVGLPWIADGASESDSAALAWFVDSFAVQSAETAKLLVEYFWFTDGVTLRERDLLRHLAALAESDPDAAQLIADLIWVRDGINAIESDALNDLRSLVVNHLDLAMQVLGYAWVVNDVTYPEQESLNSISRIAQRDRTLAAQVASFPWVSERVEMTSIQRDPLYSLSVVADRDLALARELANFLDGRLIEQKTEMIRTISYMMLEDRDAFALLADQPWFNDGLDDEEAAFLSTLGAIHRVSPGLYEEFVETRFTQSRRVNLPLAGEVGIWVFQNAPFQPDEDLLDPMEEGIRNIEDYMGVTFPADRVIMVSVVRDPDGYYDIGSGQHGLGHLQVVRSESAPLREDVLFHELAHFYYDFFPIWLAEGGAEFMTAIVRDRTGVESLTDRRQVAAAGVESNCYPAEFHNLYELNEKQGFYLSDGPDGCNYPFGEYFLISLTVLLGEDTVSAALRSLYLLIHSDERSFPLTGKDIYLAFLNNTPANLIGDFRDLFRAVHGGPWVDAVVHGPDDHGDDALSATELLVGQVERAPWTTSSTLMRSPSTRTRESTIE